MKQNINFFISKEEFFLEFYKFKDQNIVLLQDEKIANLDKSLSMFLKISKNIEDAFLDKMQAVFIVGDESLLLDNDQILKTINKPIYFIPTKLSSLLNFIEDNKFAGINIIAYLELFNFSANEVSKIFSLITSKISVIENLMFENLFFKKSLPSLFNQYLSIVYKLLNGFKPETKLNKTEFFKIVESYVLIFQKINFANKSIAKKACDIYSKMIKVEAYKEENELVLAYLISKLLKNFLEKAPFCEVGKINFSERYNFYKSSSIDNKEFLNFTMINENKLSIYKMKEIRIKLAKFYEFSFELLVKCFETMKQIKEDNGFNFIGTINSEAIACAISFSPDYLDFNALTIMRNFGYLN